MKDKQSSFPQHQQNDKQKIVDDNSKQVKVYQEIKLDNIKNLIRCAYLVGQEQGLKGNLLTNPNTIEEREFLVNILTSKHIL